MFDSCSDIDGLAAGIHAMNNLSNISLQFETLTSQNNTHKLFQELQDLRELKQVGLCFSKSKAKLFFTVASRSS